MPTHIALLRGINVGGGGKVPMADLRTLVGSLGHREVSTYIQTGNIIFTPATSDQLAVARELEAAIEATFAVRTAAIVLSKAELAEVISANPYPDPPEPRYVHGVFLPADPDEAMQRRLGEAMDKAVDRGSRDEAVIVGRTLYLHTPDGFGTSELAKELLLARRSNPFSTGTARNWNTITKLLALCTA
jgi:uncharacterized protein (DUF1697 family)